MAVSKSGSKADGRRRPSLRGQQPGQRQRCRTGVSDPHGQDQNQGRGQHRGNVKVKSNVNGSGRGRPLHKPTHQSGEFDAVGLAEVVPGFAVVVVDVGLGATFGAEGNGGGSEDVGQGAGRSLRPCEAPFGLDKYIFLDCWRCAK
jgi:hypothetical protein